MCTVANTATGADWVSAIGTVLAVAVALLLALFREDIMRLRWRPELGLSIRMGPPDCQKIPLNVTDAGSGTVLSTQDSYYLRLWVENSGRKRATYVQVFASELKEKQENGTFHIVQPFLPMNLKWAHSHEVFADAISPGMGKHCDLAHVYVLPEHQIKFPTIAKPYKPPAVLELDTEVVPTTHTNMLGPGTYLLTVRIAASNSRPVIKVLEITFLGEWFYEEADMFTKGVRIAQVADS